MAENVLNLIKGNLLKNGEPFYLTSEEYIGFYFSAQWCPPCRGFTPKLKNYYSRLVENGKKFEVVFVSSDSDQESFDEYFKEMPWAAITFENRELKDHLNERYGVRGYPTLVVVDKCGELVTTNGRSVVIKKTGDEPELTWT